MEENKLKTIEGELEAPADFTSPDVLYRDLVASIRKYHPSDDLSMIEKAYQLADNAHKDQKRKSGEPSIRSVWRSSSRISRWIKRRSQPDFSTTWWKIPYIQRNNSPRSSEKRLPSWSTVLQS